MKPLIILLAILSGPCFYGFGYLVADFVSHMPRPDMGAGTEE